MIYFLKYTAGAKTKGTMESKSEMLEPKVKVKKPKKPKLTRAQKRLLRLKAAEEMKKKLLRV